MPGDRLDAHQRALLSRIDRGERTFSPPERRSEEDCRAFNLLVETLNWLRQHGYIADKDLKVLRDSRPGPCRYSHAIVTGLTYEGLRAAQEVEPAPAAQVLSPVISSEGLHQCRRDFDRAVGTIATDPDQAIGSACSLLESICKAILDRAGQQRPDDQSIQPLVKAVLAVLDLAPGSEAAPDIKGALKGLASIAQGVGALRTKAGAAHGRGLHHAPLAPRHARLAVNAAATVGLFLLETALAKEDSSTL